MEKYVIRDREAGNEIVRSNTLKQAQMILKKFETEDKKDGIYEENFYEIYDLEKEEII